MWMVNRGTSCLLLSAVVLAAFIPGSLAGDEIPGGPEGDRRDETDVWKGAFMKTLGGRQFWGDVCFYHGWSIQQNILTGHYRLLDSADIRHCWGSYDTCMRHLAELRKERQLAPMSGKAVVLIHGMVRSSKSLHAMEKPFSEAGYQVFAFDYPSTRLTIPESAEFLRRSLSSLEGIEEINFVVHSMGGLVVRAYLQQECDPRIHRMVMLGVPNRGAHLADRLKENVLFRSILGPAGQQLISATDGFIASLPVPDFEFAVIAGGRGTPNGYNPLIPGDDDATVSVESTRLPGATDFIQLPVLHTLMMGNPDVVASSLRFVTTGALRADGSRQPIPAVAETVVNGAGHTQPAGRAVGRAFVPGS